MQRRRFFTVCASALLLLGCGALGGTHPTDTLIFPGASEIDIKTVEAALARELNSGVDGYLQGLPKPSRSKLYKIPDDTTYTTVKTFYQDGLTPLGYTPFDTVRSEGDTLNYYAWINGVSIVIIGVVENTADSGAYLLVLELP